MSEKNQIVVGYGSYATDPAWQVVIDHAPQIYAVIGNPDSGPGGVQNLEWLALFKRLKAAGIKVLGYVATGYGAKALSLVRGELIRWRDWYQPDGTFFDESAKEKEKIEYYRGAVGHARALGSQAIVVCNFGTVPDQSLFDLADISCIAETDQETYVNKPFPGWVFQKPSGRIYNIIHSVNDPAKVRNRINQNNAGFWTMVTTVTKPGADGPEFDIKDIIWPAATVPPGPAPTPAPPAPVPLSADMAQMVEMNRGLMRKLRMGADATIKDIPARVDAVMSENDALKSGITKLKNSQIFGELVRRFPD